MAAEAVYHDFCRTRFMLKKELGKKNQEARIMMEDDIKTNR